MTVLLNLFRFRSHTAIDCSIPIHPTAGPQPTDIFGGEKRCNLFLYLTDTYVCESFGGWQLPDCPLWLRARPIVNLWPM